MSSYKPRSGERMQPTAQAVGGSGKRSKPGGGERKTTAQLLSTSFLGVFERYSVEVNDENKEALGPGVGLCANCRSMRLIESDRGSTFYLCELSVADPTFPKYPRLPVLQCSGYQPLRGDAPLSFA